MLYVDYSFSAWILLFDHLDNAFLSVIGMYEGVVIVVVGFNAIFQHKLGCNGGKTPEKKHQPTKSYLQAFSHTHIDQF